LLRGWERIPCSVCSSRLAIVTSGSAGSYQPLLSHVRKAAYLACVNYWIISSWCKERPVRTMAPEMREKMFTLQTLLEYDLEDCYRVKSCEYV
jgi:hypothetical protein